MIEMRINPEEKVKTWNGQIVPRVKCKLIGKKDPQYYEINVDCFYVKDKTGKYKWTRLNTGKIAYNLETDSYELTSILNDDPNLVKGIIDHKKKEGYFKYNPYTTVLLTESSKDTIGIFCVSNEVAKNLGYDLCSESGYYTKGHVNTTRKNVLKYKNINKLNYNADENNNLFVDIVTKFNENKKHIKIDNTTEAAAKIFPYSFGLEFESRNGTIPKNYLNLLGLVPLKDGSLRKDDGTEPYEYTSIPLTGTIGLQIVKNQCEILTKYCDFDQKCSLHLHLGSLRKRTPEFVIAFYKLCYNLQNEIFSMFPLYKQEPEKYVENFQKNYCKKLPDIGLNNFVFKDTKNAKDAQMLVKKAFDVIYYNVSDNLIKETNDEWNINTLEHPKGRTDKWNYLFRYHWVNLVPYMFSEKKTIEFRLHTPTYNFTKVSCWMFICSALIQYSEQYTNQILNNDVEFSLKTVIEGYIDNFGKSFYKSEYNELVSKYLSSYIEYRKNCIQESFEKGDIYSLNIEFKKDSKFNFKFPELNSIY